MNKKAAGIVLLLALLLGIGIKIGWERKADVEEIKAGYSKIRVVMDDNYPPYVFRNEEGELRGILIDYWRLWEQKTGIKAEIDAKDWNEALAEMKEGKYDVIDTLFYTEERARIFTYSKPYATIEVPIFFHQNFYGITDADSLRGVIVGVKKGDASEAFLRAHGVKNLATYASYENIIHAAKNREILIFVMDKPPALYYLYKYGLIDQFKSSEPLYTGQFHRAVRKGDEEILQVVEAGFSLISKSEYEKIEKKWLGQPLYSNFYNEQLRRILFHMALVLLIILLWNYLLQREVRKKTQELKAEKELLSITLASIGDGVVATDEEGKITSLNRAASEISGFSEDEALGLPFSRVFRLVNEETETSEACPVSRVLKTGQIEEMGNHVYLIHKKGHKVPIADSAAPIKDSKGKIWGAVVVFRDVTREKEQREEIVYLSYHDILTGLYNRRFMEEKIKTLENEKIPVTVVMGDVNGLKLTNDVFGHEAGDELLKKAAQVFKEACSDKDIIGRWGEMNFCFCFLIPSLMKEKRL